MKSSERVLFFSLWGLLILGAALWRFSGREIKPLENFPSVILARELVTWFERAGVVSSTPTLYTVEIGIQPQYREELRGKSRQLLLGYHYLGENTVLSQGIVECVMEPGGVIRVELPNPNRVSAKTIQLSLAR